MLYAKKLMHLCKNVKYICEDYTGVQVIANFHFISSHFVVVDGAGEMCFLYLFDLFSSHHIFFKI